MSFYSSLHFKFVSGRPSSGKTFNMLRDATSLAAEGINVLIVQPTIDLNRQTRKALGDTLAFVTVTDDADGGPVPELRNRITDNTLTEPQIVLSTHAALERVGIVAGAEKWALYVDEEMTALAYHSYDVPKTHSLITEHLSHVQDGAHESIIQPHDPKAFRAFLAEAVNDTLLRPLDGLMQMLCSTVHTTFVPTAQFENLINPCGSEGKLVAASELSPLLFSQFKRVVFLAADFEDTIFYKLMRKHADFTPYEPIQSKLRAPRDTFDEVDVAYLLDERHWSMRYRRDTCKTATKSACAAIMKDLNGERLAFVDNEEFKARYYLDGAKEMPFNPHGLNNLSDIDNVASLTSIIAAPAQREFLIRRGLKEDEVFIAYTAMPAWQALCRGSLRKPDNSNPKKLYVGERRIADWIASKLPGCAIRRLETKLPQTVNKGGRSHTYANAAEKQRAYRLRKKNNLNLRNEGSTIAPVRDETYYNNIGKVTFSRYKDTRALLAFSQVTCENIHEFFDILESMYSRTFPRKESNDLITTTVFESVSGIDTEKGKANIVHVNGVWMDNDGGSLRHRDFVSILPRIQMVCFNTFSHTSEYERYRVFIPTLHAMSSDQYEAVFDALIARVVQDHGPDHGFDLSKRPATSLFYAPCQAYNAADSFFIRFLDAPRSPLVPKDWLAGRPIIAPKQVSPTRSTSHGADLSAIFARYEDQIVLPGNGNEAFKELALSLYGKGLPEEDILAILPEKAYLAKHPDQRLAQIDPLLDWCRQNFG